MDKAIYIKEFLAKSIIKKADIDKYEENRKSVFYELLENGCIELKKCDTVVAATVKDSYHTHQEVYMIYNDKIMEKYKNLL